MTARWDLETSCSLPSGWARNPKAADSQIATFSVNYMDSSSRVAEPRRTSLTRTWRALHVSTGRQYPRPARTTDRRTVGESSEVDDRIYSANHARELELQALIAAGTQLPDVGRLQAAAGRTVIRGAWKGFTSDMGNGQGGRHSVLERKNPSLDQAAHSSGRATRERHCPGLLRRLGNDRPRRHAANAADGGTGGSSWSN